MIHEDLERFDPDHHLWRNGRLWWIAVTVRRPDGQTRRIRVSLRTADLDEARRRRDRALGILAQTAGLRLALRTGQRESWYAAQPPRSCIDRGGLRLQVEAPTANLSRSSRAASS